MMLIFSIAEASGTAVVIPNAVVVLPRTIDWHTQQTRHTIRITSATADMNITVL